MTRYYCRVAIVFCFFALVGGLTGMAEATSYVAYISDSPAAASAYWVTKDAGFFKKHGLDFDLFSSTTAPAASRLSYRGSSLYERRRDLSHQRQTGGRGHRHHQQPDQHVALLHIWEARD